ncbi:MAG: hypothetical protein POG74_08270 [Acidocella sp.]|nr:hypothetical protein [Acidocella sp.]
MSTSSKKASFWCPEIGSIDQKMRRKPATPLHVGRRTLKIKQTRARNGKILLYGVLVFFGLDILYVALQNLLAYMN